MQTTWHGKSPHCDILATLGRRSLFPRQMRQRWVGLLGVAAITIASPVITPSMLLVQQSEIARKQPMAVDGLITIRSRSAPKQTMERLEAAVKAKGMRVFAHVDHAAGAAEVGMTLRPTDLLIFGHPKGGTPLMESVQTSGIDLPLKALVWRDENGTTWLSYNDPVWLAARHGGAAGAEAAVGAMADALRTIAAEATSTG